MESVSWHKITAGLWTKFSAAGYGAFHFCWQLPEYQRWPIQEWLSACCHKSEVLAYEVSIYNSSFHAFKFIAALDTCTELLFGFAFLPPCVWGRQSLWEVQKKHRAACDAWRFAAMPTPVSALLAVVLCEKRGVLGGGDSPISPPGHCCVCWQQSLGFCQQLKDSVPLPCVGQLEKNT